MNPMSPELTELFDAPQFSLAQEAKEALLVPELAALTRWHGAGSTAYSDILGALGALGIDALDDVPFLPVSLFKTHELRSVPPEEVFKVMTSSGTTGQAVSRVYLDKDTAALQTKALSRVMARVLGNQRLPMLIVDTPHVVKDRKSFSARGAGVLGMMPFGRRHHYALDDNMQLDLDGLHRFLDEHRGSPILVFGFTFMVWKYFLQALVERGADVDLGDGVLIHSGGWKKLTDEAVGNPEFKRVVAETTGIRRVHNFYGMVEQVGSVFLEADDGYLRPPNFADAIIRDPMTWEESPDGVPGVVEVLSVLPRSYPGHALLTEDWGVVHGVDGPEDQWSGKRLEILGRVPRTELRGCSDTHAFDRRPA